MANKKKDLESLRRLRELERQLKEYTEEDYLREAEKMEREMAKQQVDFEPPEGFFEQVIAKGKQLEAEKRRQEKASSGQQPQKKSTARGVESGSAQAAALMKLGGEPEKEEADLRKKAEAGLQEKEISGGGLAGLSGGAAEEEKQQGIQQQEIKSQEIKSQEIKSQETEKQEIKQQKIAQQEMTRQEPAQESEMGNLDAELEPGLGSAGEKDRVKAHVSEPEATNSEDVRLKLKPLTFQAEEEYRERIEIGEAAQVSLRTAKRKDGASGQFTDAEAGDAGSRERAAVEHEKARSGGLRGAGQASGRKTGRGKLRWRVLLALGVLVAFMVFGVSSGGKRHFSFEQKERGGADGQHIAIYNDDYEEGLTDELEGYDRIEQEMGIDALKIGDRPYDMIFEQVQIEGQGAMLQFSYQEEQYLILLEYISSSTTNVKYILDGEQVDSVYNDFIGIELLIREEVFDNGETKYSSVFSYDNAYYIISATLDLEEFKMILKDLYF